MSQDATLIAIAHGIAVVSGAAIALTEASFRLFPFALAGAFLVLILTAYVASWRRGHSGMFFIPKWSGPFGLKGLGLAARGPETRVITVALAFIAGLLGALLWLVSE